MSIFRKIFGKKENAENPKQAFWNWFQKNNHRFRPVIGDTNKVSEILDELIKQMNPYDPWLKALVGPASDTQMELVITADGDIALFSKVEELVQAAPPMEDWLITAHKPAIGIDKMKINMHGYEFGSDKMKFYPVLEAGFPDEVNIVLTHDDFEEAKQDEFYSGTSIFLENTLGEINTALLLDSFEIKAVPSVEEKIDLIPLTKLNDYLVWRQKEFIEKYEHTDKILPEEKWTVLQATGEKGGFMIATMNTAYASWEYQSAYPWLVQVNIQFKGNNNGMPHKNQSEYLQNQEDIMIELLAKNNLALYLGHSTHDYERSIYWYSHNYNTVSKMIHPFVEQMPNEYKVVFFIKKDKYWRAMDWYFNAKKEEEID
jgi:hypothetical protein